MARLHSIAVIHARGGSKRVPLKNIKPLGGKPLIAWCIAAARCAMLLDRIIVSTDHDGIMQAARAAGAEVPFRRPADLSEDVASELVTQHAVEFHESETGKRVDIAVTIQPTTPFVRGTDIDSCIAALSDSAEFDAAVSVAPIHERPEWMYQRNDDGTLVNWMGLTATGDFGISQTLKRLFMPNGAVYATRRDALYSTKSVFGTMCFGHPMDRTRSVDIDDPVDFLIAEGVAQYLADHPDE